MLPTASSVERAIDCAFSTVAEQAPDKPNPARKRGEVIHAVIASQLRGWPTPDIGKHQISVDFEQLRAYLGKGELRCELAMAYHPAHRTAEALQENIGREYPREPELIYGSADIIVLREHALIVDIKTGRHRSTSAADNWQLRTLAVMLAHAYQVVSVSAALAYLDRAGNFWFDDVTWSGFDIADFADELEIKHAGWLAAQVTPPAPTPTPLACQWCRAICSARLGEVAA